MGIFSAASESHAQDIVSCIDSALLHDTVLACVEAGWLLSFGSSRDGGAVSLRVKNDDGGDAVWCGSSAELERALEAVVSSATGQPYTRLQDPPSKPSSGPTAASGGKGAGERSSSKTGA